MTRKPFRRKVSGLDPGTLRAKNPRQWKKRWGPWERLEGCGIYLLAIVSGVQRSTSCTTGSPVGGFDAIVLGSFLGPGSYRARSQPTAIANRRAAGRPNRAPRRRSQFPPSGVAVRRGCARGSRWAAWRARSFVTPAARWCETDRARPSPGGTLQSDEATVRAPALEGPGEADQPLARPSQGRLAGRQHHQIGREPEAIRHLRPGAARSPVRLRAAQGEVRGRGPSRAGCGRPRPDGPRKWSTSASCTPWPPPRSQAHRGRPALGARAWRPLDLNRLCGSGSKRWRRRVRRRTVARRRRGR